MRILHLSDIHFGLDRDGKSKHAFTIAGKPAPDALVEVLAQPSLPQQPPVNLIVLSGDIGWSGIKDDYVDAEIACRALQDRFKAPVLLVPGNHDVDRGDAVADAARQDAFIAFLEDFYGPRLNEVYPFLKRGAGTRLSKREALIAIYRDDSSQTIVVGINSASRISGFDHCRRCNRRIASIPPAKCKDCKIPLPIPTRTIAIEPLVAKTVEGELSSLPQRESWFTTLVLHHNMLPFDEPDEGGHIDLRSPGTAVDSDMITNSTQLHAWLGRTGFHLLLHGHKHQPNGRMDTLFRRDDPNGRRIVVLGAGSAGVVAGDRTPEPLGFFDIDRQRLSHRRFLISVTPYRIATGSLTPYATPDFARFSCDVGPPPPEPPHMFYAESVADCHAAIARVAQGRGILRNVTSIVDFSPPGDFHPPPTADRAGKPVQRADVESSFAALHPEADPHNLKNPWHDLSRVQERIKDIHPRFQFKHGPRMFEAVPESSSAIERALELLDSDSSTSHAYVSVFRSAVDLRTSADPPPGLTGVQFSADASAERLDVTFLFRKLDLAFWWSVNMYEALQLWMWAFSRLKHRKHYSSGRITFTAVLAEWKKVDTASFTNRLDDLDRDRMFYLASLADVGQPAALIERLKEKRDRTNQNNIDVHGIDLLSQVVGTIVASPERTGGAWNSLVLPLREAAENMAQAEAEARRGATNMAVTLLEKSLQRIREVEDNLLRMSGGNTS